MSFPKRLIRASAVGLASLCAAATARAECSDQTQRDIAMHRFDPARAEIRIQLARAPNDAGAAECMGRLLLEEGNPGEAVAWLEKAVQRDPKSSRHELWLARALGEYAVTVNVLQRPFVARRVKTTYEKAVELDPSSVDARRGLLSFFAQAPSAMGGGMDKAREQAAIVAKLNPMRGHLAYGFIAERENKPDVARKEYDAAMVATPDSAGYAHLILAKLLATKLDDFDGGEREVRLWMASPPFDAGADAASSAHYLLGAIEQHRGHNQRAKAEYDLALAQNPRNADAKKALDALK